MQNVDWGTAPNPALQRTGHALGGLPIFNVLLVERVLSVRETCRRQGRSLLEYLVGCCQAHLEGKAAPTLVERADPQLGAA